MILKIAKAFSFLQPQIRRLSNQQKDFLSSKLIYQQAIKNLQEDRLSLAEQQLSLFLRTVREESPKELNVHIFIKSRMAILSKLLQKHSQFCLLNKQIFFQNLAYRGELDPDNTKFLQNFLLSAIAVQDSQAKKLCSFIIEGLSFPSSKLKTLAAYYLIILQSLQQNKVQKDFLQEVTLKLQQFEEKDLMKFNLSKIKFFDILQPSTSQFSLWIQQCYQLLKKLEGPQFNKPLLSQSPQAVISFMQKVKLKNEHSSIILRIIGDSFFKQKQYESAYAYYQLSLLFSNRISINKNISCNIRMAEILQMKNQLEQAEEKFLSTLVLCQNTLNAVKLLVKYVEFLERIGKRAESVAYAEQLIGKRVLPDLLDTLLLKDYDFDY